MSTTPARGGRPSQDRKHPVTVRFTPSEYEKLKQQAEESGKTASDLIRATAAGITIKTRTPAIDAQALKELTHWGNNLNQLAYHCNSGSLRGENADEIRDRLRDCQRALERLDSSIRGPMIADKHNGGGTLRDAVGYAMYCIALKKDHPDYKAGERVLLVQSDNLLLPIVPPADDIRACRAWAKLAGQKIEEWTVDKRDGKPMPKSLFVAGSISFQKQTART